MPRFFCLLLSVFCFLIFNCATVKPACGQIHPRAAARLRAGAARVEITPPVGTPLAGYSKRHGRPSVGIRDPLYIRAVGLSDGEDTVVILSADLLIFPQPVADRILERICRELDLPRPAVVLTATHTHSGTGSIGHGFLFEKVFGAYRPEIVEGITGRAVWAARQAVHALQPISWGAASDPVFFRDLVENRAVPGGWTDPALKVLFLESGEGQMRVVLVNTAAHPTLMDSQDSRFSADFPGEICRRIEENYPGSVCLFLNGAAGDTRPRDSIGINPDQRIERFGGAVAEKVTGLISQTQTHERADLSSWGETFTLPPPKIRIGPIVLPSRIGRQMRPTSIFLNLIALDQILLVPLSAELTSEVGVELKQRLMTLGVQPVLVGYADGYIGYAVTAQRYESGSYEAAMTWYGPHLGEFLIERLYGLAGSYKEVRSQEGGVR